MASRNDSEIEVQAADNHSLMAATSGLMSKMAIAAEPLDSGPGGIVGTLDALPERGGGGGGGGGGEGGIEGGFKLKGYGGAASPRQPSTNDAASVGPAWLKPPPPIKVAPPQPQQLTEDDEEGADGEGEGAADAPNEPYVVLSSSQAAPKLRPPFPAPADAAPALGEGEGDGDGDGEDGPEVVAVQPLQWAKVRPGAEEQQPEPMAAEEPEAQLEVEAKAEPEPAAAFDAAAFMAAAAAQQHHWQREPEEERQHEGAGEDERGLASSASQKWQPPARKAANPLGGAKGSLMSPGNPDAEVVRASDVIEEIRSPPIRVTDLSKQLKEHFEHGAPLGGGLNGMHERDTVSAPGGSMTPSTARAKDGTLLTMRQHDLVNTANVALVLQAGEFKLKPGIDVVPYDQLKELRLEDGLDVSRKEEYLSEEEFEVVFGMDKEDFRAMPPWKRINAKKSKGLF